MSVPVRPELARSLVARPRRTRDLLRAGVTKRELAGPLWSPVLRGVHAWTGAGTSTDDAEARHRATQDRILAAAALMPRGAALGGWAALFLLGVRDLDGRTGPGAATLLPVPVCIGPAGRMSSRPGIAVDRSILRDEDVTDVGGVLVTTAPRSCVDIACWHGVEEGMVAGDAAARFRVARPPDVRAYAASRPRVRGIPQARRAAELLDARSASCPETRFRYVWVVEAGLPPPLVNAGVIDLDGGYLVGEADLLDVEAALVGEYDGQDHRDLARHTSDNVREEAFERHNLTVVRATALDLWPRRAELVTRIRAGRQDGLDRDRSRDRFGWQRP